MGLSVERLMTQLEITTSAWSSGSGISSMWSFQELNVLHPGLGLVHLGQLEHLVGHVEPVCLAARRDPLGREQHVYAAAAAQV